MKTLKLALYAGVIAVAASCTKTTDDDIIPNNRIVTFEVPEMTLGEELSKVTEFVQSGHHYFQWEVGDELKVFSFKGTKADGNATTADDYFSVLGKFTATSVTNPNKRETSATFTGSIDPSVTVYDRVFAIYPYNSSLLPYTNKSTQSGYNTATSAGYQIRCKVPTEQTGNAIEHIYLTSRLSKINTETMVFDPLTKFVLATPITIFSVQSTNEIVKVEIKGDGIKAWAGNAVFRTGAGAVYDRGDAFTITLKREEGGELTTLVPPDEVTTLSFAARQFEASGAAADIKITFTFYDVDGNTCVKVYKPGKGQSANTIINLGKLILEDFS